MQWNKLPGLFYKHELEQVIEFAGRKWYRFEKVAKDDKEKDLIAVCEYDPAVKERIE